MIYGIVSGLTAANLSGVYCAELYQPDSKMEVRLPNDYRRPRESGGPGANAAASQALDSRFHGNDE